MTSATDHCAHGAELFTTEHARPVNNSKAWKVGQSTVLQTIATALSVSSVGDPLAG
jgi:hypothetical protein